MKKLISIISILALLTATALIVNAHSGKTDSSGGHTDNSTGEYHYHHGYPAHDHYDMDGDGDIDCPYDFNDQTGANSGGNTGGKSSASNYSSSNDNVIVRTETITKTVTKEVPYIPSWVYWVISTLGIFVIILFFVVIAKRKKLLDQEHRFIQDALDEEARVKYGIETLHNSLVKKYGVNYLYDISGVPDDSFVDDDFLPHDKMYLVNPIYDGYTFFLSNSPYNHNTKYHHRSCRYAREFFPINAYTLRKTKRYQCCKLCPCSLPDTDWVEEYSKHYMFLKKYVDLHTDRQQEH